MTIAENVKKLDKNEKVEKNQIKTSAILSSFLNTVPLANGERADAAKNQ